MGLKGSFEGMGTLWPFSKVSSFLFCSPPHWRHIWLLKKGGWNCVFGLDLLCTLVVGVLLTKNQLQLACPLHHTRYVLKIVLYIVLIHLPQGLWILLLDLLSTAFGSIWGNQSLISLLFRCVLGPFLALLAGASVACLSPPPHKGLWRTRRIIC